MSAPRHDADMIGADAEIDRESRVEAQRFAADLASDLRAWLEWATLTGGLEAPMDEVAAAPAPRLPASRPATAPPRVDSSPPPPLAPPSEAPAARPTTPTAPRTPTQRPPSMPSPRVSPRAASGATPVAPPPTGLVSPGEAGLKQVRDELGDCQRCRLGRERKNIVYGIGNPNARLVLVGEAPGQQEDLTGEPFVGRSGQLLTRMLAAIGLKRDDVYICNVIKCRPPQNRDPLPDEIATCSPFLHRQLQAISPSVILTLGRFAAVNVVGVDASLGELRKRVGSWHGTPIISSYHPSYLLRTPRMKRAAWEDLLTVRRLLREPANPS